MERVLILLTTTVMLFMATGVQASSHRHVNITRMGCGVSKLCVETPDDCDPTGNSSCLFGSVTAGTPMAPNGVNMSFELSGKSPGYIALGLTVNETMGINMLFICGKNGSDTFFFQAVSKNGTSEMFQTLKREVMDIRGTVNNNTNMIQCEFNVPGLNATNTRTFHVTTFTIILGHGNVTGGIPGPLRVALNTGPLNLADPAATATPPTGGAGRQVSHAGLLLLSALTLGVLKTV
ncbi:putative ferric-chelate reductase 1 [Odontesthes bonariensis]|uniref:putative ferric-chelate reductase 1 n=1 Tax=Odontesthes bonariensis TaxID=219752 RepID=UPI003F58FB98